jgi:hypothetical protein
MVCLYMAFAGSDKGFVAAYTPQREIRAATESDPPAGGEAQHGR